MRFTALRAQLIVLILTLIGAAPAAAFETVSWHTMPVAAGQAMVRLSSTAQPARLLARLAARGYTIRHIAGRDGVAREPSEWLARGASPDADRYMLVEFPATRALDDALAELAALDGVAGAHPNHILQAFFTPNDPLYETYQQNLRQIDLESAWDTTLGAGVIVAVVDTGYVASGLEDAAVHLLAGYNFPDNSTDVNDTDGHGTLVANVIAEATDNGLDAAGATGEASILPCKVFQTGDSGALSSDVTRAVDWAVQNGAQVINMSLGGSSYDSTAAAAMHDAAAANVVLVAASGNDGKSQVSYPAAYADVIAVGSCNKHPSGELPARSSFSNYGQQLALVAPGEEIYGETTGSGGLGIYEAWGTSVASPHVAAAAALMIAASQAKFGSYAASDIRTALQDTANRAAGTGWTSEIGWGEVDVANAMAALGVPIPQPSSGGGTTTTHHFLCGIAPAASPLDAAALAAPLAWLWLRRRRALRRPA